MTTTQTTPVFNSKQTRYKGSLAGTLVRTLLIFTIIPLTIMAGMAYFRTRALLYEQANAQSKALLTTQIAIVDREVAGKEARFEKLLGGSDFQTLLELALHANPKTDEYRVIRNGILQEFEQLNQQENKVVFDQFLLADADGNIKIATDQNWQEEVLDRLPQERIATYNQANRLLDEACDKVRTLSHEFGEALLKQFGLKAQLEALLEAIGTSKIEVELVTHGLNQRKDFQLELNLYRIIQELVHNVIKHAQATHISIQVIYFKEHVNVFIDDNGRGFDGNAIQDSSGL